MRVYSVYASLSTYKRTQSRIAGQKEYVLKDFQSFVDYVIR